MATNQDIEWTRGQTEEWVLSITQVDGSPEDLTGEAVEFEVKKYEGEADPPALHLEVGAGLTVRAQTGQDVGKADLLATSTQTFALAAGTWHYDVFVTRQGGARKRAMFGRLVVKNIVNFP
jgi:hypothetical protein